MKNNNSFLVLGHTITPQQVSGNYDMIIGVTPPKVPGPPPHFHNSYDEVFFVLEGSMHFIVEGIQKTLHPGQMIDLPKNTVHTFSNAGEIPCKWINIHSPKGFLSFFEKFSVATDTDNAFEKSVDKQVIEEVMQTAADYDMIIRI